MEIDNWKVIIMDTLYKKIKWEYLIYIFLIGLNIFCDALSKY